MAKTKPWPSLEGVNGATLCQCPVESLRAKRCGCGRHDLSADAVYAVHWRKKHWAILCAMNEALRTITRGGHSFPPKGRI